MSVQPNESNIGLTEIYVIHRYWYQHPISMWLLSLIFVLFQFFLQLSSGVLLTQLMTSFHASAWQASLIASAYYYVYVLLQTPAGLLIDKYGPKRLLSIGALICGIGCYFFASTQSISMAMLSRILMGSGASFAFIGSIHIAGEWFPPRRFSLMIGLAETMGMLGTIYGCIYLTKMIEQTSWRTILTYSSYLSFTLAILLWSILRDDPPHKSQKNNKSWHEFILNIRAIFKHPGLWVNGIYSGLLFSVVTVFAALWAIPYYSLSLHISNTQSTIICSMTFLGIAICSPIMGIIYHRIQNKNQFMANCSYLLAIILFILIYYPIFNSLIIASLFFLTGCLISVYVFNYSIIHLICPPHIRSTGIGFTNTLCVITAPIFQLIIGYLINNTHRNNILPPEYSVADFQHALWIIPLTIIASGMIAYIIPKPNQSETTVHEDT